MPGFDRDRLSQVLLDLISDPRAKALMERQCACFYRPTWARGGCVILSDALMNALRGLPVRQQLVSWEFSDFEALENGVFSPSLPPWLDLSRSIEDPVRSYPFHVVTRLDTTTGPVFLDGLGALDPDEAYRRWGTNLETGEQIPVRVLDMTPELRRFIEMGTGNTEGMVASKYASARIATLLKPRLRGWFLPELPFGGMLGLAAVLAGGWLAWKLA